MCTLVTLISRLYDFLPRIASWPSQSLALQAFDTIFSRAEEPDEAYLVRDVSDHTAQPVTRQACTNLCPVTFPKGGQET